MTAHRTLHEQWPWPPGTEVIYTDDTGKERASVTASKAWVLGDRTPVLLLRGHGLRGCYLLDRVRLAPKQSEVAR